MRRPLEYMIGAGILLAGTAGYLQQDSEIPKPQEKYSGAATHYEKIPEKPKQGPNKLENILLGKWLETDRHHAMSDPNKSPVITGFYIKFNKDRTYERFINDKVEVVKGVYELVPYKNAKGEDKLWIRFYDSKEQEKMYKEKGIPAQNPWSITIPKDNEFVAYIPELTKAKYHREMPKEKEDNKDKEKKK